MEDQFWITWKCVSTAGNLAQIRTQFTDYKFCSATDALI